VSAAIYGGLAVVANFTPYLAKREPTGFLLLRLALEAGWPRGRATPTHTTHPATSTPQLEPAWLGDWLGGDRSGCLAVQLQHLPVCLPGGCALVVPAGAAACPLGRLLWGGGCAADWLCAQRRAVDRPG
jgi:hypothetical protein